MQCYMKTSESTNKTLRFGLSAPALPRHRSQNPCDKKIYFSCWAVLLSGFSAISAIIWVFNAHSFDQSRKEWTHGVSVYSWRFPGRTDTDRQIVESNRSFHTEVKILRTSFDSRTVRRALLDGGVCSPSARSRERPQQRIKLHELRFQRRNVISLNDCGKKRTLLIRTASYKSFFLIFESL